MTMLKLRMMALDYPDSFIVHVNDSLVDTWVSVSLIADENCGDTHDLHIEVGEDNTLGCIAYPLIPTPDGKNTEADVEQPIDVHIIACDDPHLDLADGVYVYHDIESENPINLPPDYEIRQYDEDLFKVISMWSSENYDQEDIVARTTTKEMADAVLNHLRNPDILNRYTYLIDMLLRQIREYSDNQYVVVNDPDVPKFDMSLVDIAKEVGIKFKKNYRVSFSKSYTRSGEIEIEAYSEDEAERIAYSMMGESTGSMERNAGGDTIELEEIAPS